jgi:hypothetical protein
MKRTGTIIGFALLLGLSLPTGVVFAAATDYTNYWTMDEGTGRSVNDSVGGQNGVMTGSSTGFGWATGKVGTAIGMDGTMGTGVALPNGFLRGSQGTISLWLDAQSLTDQNVIFSGKSTSDNNIYAALLVDHDGRVTFQLRDTTSGNDRKAQGAKLLNKNEWYNVVFTANGQTYRVYVNGEEVTVAGDNLGKWYPDITNHTFSYRIGMIDANPLSGSWNGYLDDLRIYSRALSLDEVKDLYSTTNAQRPTNPAGVAPKVTLTVSEDHIPFGGSVALMWNSVNTDSCTFSGAYNGSVATTGSMVFTKLAADSRYSLSCGNAKYGNDVANVNVFVGATGVATSSVVVVPLPPVTPSEGGTVYARNLTVGSRGADVTALQNHLIAKGYLASTATGYFGGLTKSALVKLQKEMGLPSTGYFGPMTRGALNK